MNKQYNSFRDGNVLFHKRADFITFITMDIYGCRLNQYQGYAMTAHGVYLTWEQVEEILAVHQEMEAEHAARVQSGPRETQGK